MKRMHHIIIMVAALLLCSTALHAKDEDKNRFHIDNGLYKIYERAYKMMHNKDPRYQALSDSLFDLAASMGEEKVQCLMLDLDCSYAMLIRPNDEAFIHKYIKREREFAEKTPYKQYVFGGWGRHIIDLIEKIDMRCMDEMNEFQHEAFRLKNGYGMARSYEFYSAIYKSLKLYNSAVVANSIAIDYQKRYGNPEELYRFYFNMANLYHVLEDFDNAIKYANMSLASKYITTNVKLKCLDIKARLYYDKHDYKNFVKNLRLYEEVIEKNKKLVTQSRIDNLGYLKVLYFTSVDNNPAEALKACNNINSAIRYSAQVILYEHTHNFKEAYKARQALNAINKHAEEERLHRVSKIQKMIRRNEIELQRSEIEQSNQKLLQQQAALAATLAREQLDIEEKNKQRSQLATKTEMERMETWSHYHERQKAQNQTRLLEERERMAQLEAIDSQLGQQRLMVSGVLIISIIAAAISWTIVYYQNKHAKTLVRLRAEALESAKHKDMLIDRIQQALNPTAQGMRRQVSTIAQEMHATNTVSRHNALAVQRYTDEITSTVDQLIEQSDPHHPLAKTTIR